MGVHTRDSVSSDQPLSLVLVKMRLVLALLLAGCLAETALGHKYFSPFDFLEHEKATVKRGRLNCSKLNLLVVASCVPAAREYVWAAAECVGYESFATVESRHLEERVCTASSLV